jgi:ADP-heptose:LPS heptosyltransferase
MGQKPKLKDKGWLLCRFGGVGDGLILTAVCKAIKEQDPEAIVHFAIREGQEGLYLHNPSIARVITIRRMPPSGIDCIKTRGIWTNIDCIKGTYFRTIDYKNSIENNSPYPKLPYGFWVRTMNSNYQNWVDLSLGWANIDPTIVSDDTKRPKIFLKDAEIEKAKKEADCEGPKIGIHMISSSLARTWYYARVLAPLLLNKYPNGAVFFWTGSSWIKYHKKTQTDLGSYSLRQSAALVSCLDLLIASDSAFSHVAEAVGTRSLNLYTTVPAWTRSKYYKYATNLQAKTKCSPCFAIWSECPLAEDKAVKSLSEREKFIIHLNQNKVPLETACRQLNTTPGGLELEFEAIRKKIQGLKQAEAPCLRSIDPDEVLLEADKLLGNGMNSQATCSIIVVNSGNDYIDRLKQSIKANTDYPYELIVIPQGKRNYAQNCNLGVEKAKGFYLVFMNDDTVVFKGWLSRLIRRFDATGAGAVGPWGSTQRVPLKEGLSIYEDRALSYNLERVENLSGFCLLTSRKILDQVGPWDEEYSHMFEDTDLTMRIGEFRPLYLAGDIFVWHKNRGTPITQDLIRRIDLSQNRWEKKFGTQLPYRMASNVT